MVATALQHALDGFSTALDHLVKVVEDGALEDLDASGMVGFFQAVEQVRNRIPLVDHMAISHAVERELPARLCQRSIGRVLASSLHISMAEAGRRVRAAEHLGPRHSMIGEALGAWRPHLAQAQRRGEVTPEQVGVIDTELRKVDCRGFDPASVEAGERILTDATKAVTPEELRGLAERVVDAIDPDGTLPDDEHQKVSRFFHLRQARDGSFRGEFRLTPGVGQKLRAVLVPLSAARTTTFDLDGRADPTTCADGDAAEGGQPGLRAQVGRHVVEPDPRTHGQRMHDAMESVCDRLLRSDSLPDSGGTPTSLVIIINEDDLEKRTGVGHFSDGSSIRADRVIDLADQAEVAWCLKSSKGAVLALGRSRRLASPAQTLALTARDGGCSFPGCDSPPEWSERHHIVSWVDGGSTDLDNLTLLCRYHHHNFEQRGWRCRLTVDRLPAWIPPKWVDRDQQPIVHPRILINRWNPQGPLSTADPLW